MSLERVLKILKNFGLQRTDSEVYVYLAKKGPKKKTDLFGVFEMSEEQLVKSLENLQSKGIITATVEKSSLFSAKKFEEVIDLFIKANIEEAYAIRENKEGLLAIWREMTERIDT